MTSIPRSHGKLSVALFEKALELYEKQPWLKKKKAEVGQLHAICNSDEELELILDILERFHYVPQEKLDFYLQQVASKITTAWGLSPIDTCIVSKDTGSSDSSVAINYMIKTTFSSLNGGWSGKNFSLNLGSTIDDNKVNNIVVVDDFSGSGNSIDKLLNWIGGRISETGVGGKSIYVCFLCAMEATEKRTYAPCLTDMYIAEVLKKGISDHYTATAVPTMLDLMLQIEKRLKKLDKKYSLGYEATEATYACLNFNMPNNNFPVFWHKKLRGGGTLSTLFQRLPK